MCVVSPPMQWEVDQIEKAFPSAVFSGVTPDLSHLSSGGFHVCLNHLWSHGFADDYSNTRHNDESPPVTIKGRVFSAAHDISFGLADMKRVHANVRKVWLDPTDPRRFAVNAINCWDGSGDAVRYDFPAQSADYATPDHQWHGHSESPRLMVDVYADEKRAWKAARARVSIITGQSKAAWLAAEGATKTTPASSPAADPGSTSTAPSGPTVPLEEENMVIIVHPNGSGYWASPKGLIWIDGVERRSIDGPVTTVPVDAATWETIKSAYGVVAHAKA